MAQFTAKTAQTTAHLAEVVQRVGTANLLNAQGLTIAGKTSEKAGIQEALGSVIVESTNVFITSKGTPALQIKLTKGTKYRLINDKDVQTAKEDMFVGCYGKFAADVSKGMEAVLTTNPNATILYIDGNEISEHAPNNNQVSFNDNSAINLPDAKQMTKLLLSGVTNGVELKTKWATLGDVQKAAILGENNLPTTATVEQLGAILAV